MTVLFEQSLVNEIRKLSNSATKRIWIASPYIGDIGSIQQIVGNKWLNKSNLSVRLLTDIEESMQLSYDTLEAFYKAGKVKSLRGLHAKIYIFDEKVVVTSANLTKTAFTKRYEMGVLIEGDEAKDAINKYEDWWEKSESITLDKLLELKNNNAGLATDGSGNCKDNLRSLWKLPASPKPANNKSGLGGLKDFEYFMACYEDLAKIYQSSIENRLAPKMPLYLEVDGLLDYLFHEDEKPSLIGITAPRNLSNQEKITEIKKYAQKYQKWAKENNDDILWRLDRSILVQKLLNPENIMQLKRTEVRKVLDCLNCMNSRKGNKTKFLSKRNTLKKIRNNWSNLLHGEEDLKTRMVDCKNNLFGFGDSSVQELIAFYRPEKYPIRNGNSNAGLRFFGYDVSI